MKLKIAVFAVAFGFFINISLIIFLPSTQVSYFLGSYQPNASDFNTSEQLICFGSLSQFQKSVRKVGYPFSSTVLTDFTDCDGDSATMLLRASLATTYFYINWLIWSLITYGTCLSIRKLYVLEKSK